MLSIQRRAVLPVLCCAGVTLLAACGGGGMVGSSDESGTLNVLLIDQPVTQDLRDTWVPKFEDETGIDVEMELVPESGLESKLSLALASGSDYDVVSTGVKNWSRLVSADWIEPLDDYLADASSDYRDGYAQNTLDAASIDGHLYSMPYQVGVDILMYNKQMFRDAGLDPENPPATMEDLVTAAEQLTTSDHAGFVARGTRSGNENSFAWSMMWFLNGGSWTGPDGEQAFDVLESPEAMTATEQYATLMTEFAPDGVNNYAFADAQLAMQQGHAAMWLDAAELGPALEDSSKSTIAGDVGYGVMTGPGDDYLVGGMWGLSIAADSANKDEAWQLIEYLTGAEASTGQVVDGINGSPARADVLESAEVQESLNPEFLAAVQESLAHSTPLYTPVIPEGNEVRSAVSLELSHVLSGDKSAEAAMADANAKIRDITADD